MLFRCVLNDEVSTAFKERWKRHKSNRVCYSYVFLFLSTTDLII